MMLVRDTSFIVIDTETTGGFAAGDRMIEIAAVCVRDGRVIDRFESLVNPGCTIPSRITRLTGISTAMVFDKPSAAEVLPEFMDFLGDGIVVAHNLNFDLQVLNGEQVRLDRPPLPNRTLCTLRLARRLLPGLRSKGLASLARFYGVKIRRHHRAMPDAEATAEIFLRFLDHLDLEFGVERLTELLAFQYRRYSRVQQDSKHVLRLREEVLSDLPEHPGVYFMKDGRGRTIYVGKAQNLNSRVRSYFTSIEGHAPRTRKMVRSVRNIDWQTTDSELDALLLESRLIKELQPRYNRAQLDYVNRPFIRIDTEHPYPRVTFSAFLKDDGAEYYGPLSGRAEATFLVDVIERFFRLRTCEDGTFARGQRCVYASMGQCLAPCEDSNAADTYREELDRVRSFLTGGDRTVIERVERAMKEASAELDFEQAALYRDWIKKLERMLERRRTIASRVLEHNVIVLHRSSGGKICLIIISRGRHVATIGVDSSKPDVALAQLKSCLSQQVEVCGSISEDYREREIDELYVISHWLYVHRGAVRKVCWHPDDDLATLIRTVNSEIETFVEPEREIAEAC